MTARARDDSGVVGLYVTVLFTAFVLTVGLIIDGGAIRAARRDVGDTAARAARAGAQELDIEQFMASGEVILDPALASDASRAVLAAVNVEGSVRVGVDRVTVTAEAPVELRFLSLVGANSRSVTATRTSRAAEGVESG